MNRNNKFRLTETFIKKWENVSPDFDAIGELVFMRTYSRVKDDLITKEKWKDCVERVTNGLYSMQKTHIIENGLGWDEEVGQKSAEEMFERIFYRKFLPPGRGLFAMGTKITEERGLFSALYNCCFISTDDIATVKSMPFRVVSDYSMLGVGCAFDCAGAGTLLINKPTDEIDIYVIPDSREGWADAIGKIIDSYFYENSKTQHFDFSLIREAGKPLKVFGGISSGPQPLIDLMISLKVVLDKNIGSMITVTTIVDVFNLIGRCIVSGNIRRTALLALGPTNSDEFLNLKNYDKNPHRVSYGWTSNNTIEAKLGMDYTNAAELTRTNGEPGYLFLENAKQYSRMCDPIDNKNHKSMGVNPCSEIVLESYEKCNIVDVFPFNCDNLEDYKRTLKFAYLYVKTVTLGKCHVPRSNRVMLRNRRVGVGLSGIAQFIAKYGVHTLREWCIKGYERIKYYDKVYSDWLAIPLSIACTTIKPSGSISLLAKATPGIHFPAAKYYIRRIRLSIQSDLILPLINAGYKTEPCVNQPESTIIVEIPVYLGEVRTVDEVSMWEQLSLCAMIQSVWSDNSVSVTVSFDKEKEGKDIKHALEYFQYQLKTVSFLPKCPVGTYPQLPYEEITKEEFLLKMVNVKEIDFFNTKNINIEEPSEEQVSFCDGDHCVINK